MLKDATFPPHRRYRSRTEWEPIGFFSEALCNAVAAEVLVPTKQFVEVWETSQEHDVKEKISTKGKR